MKGMKGILLFILLFNCKPPSAVPRWAVEIEYGVCRFDVEHKLDSGCKFK